MGLRLSITDGRYLTAAICTNGHVATDAIEYRNPGKFCPDCGAAIITGCPHCQASIRGDYHVPGVFALSHYSAPAFCHNCGKPFSWTAEKLAAAKDLADELEDLSADDRAKLKTAIEDVATGGPRAEAGAARIKRMVGKAGTAVGQALWKISVEVASEAAKKILTSG